MAKTILEARSLNKAFGGLKALDSVSFSIIRGESVGLVGGSGSGKTTLARGVLRLIPLDGGEIFYNGVRSDYCEEKTFRREFQIVFQDPQTSLNPRIRIGDALSEPALIHGLKPRVAELLDMVKLPSEHAGRWPHELSGGERQRVGVARALSLDPKFLILDEPVSSLDLSIQVQLLDLLRELKERLGLTYLFIAHDLAVIRYICDRQITMKEGRVV